LIARVKRLAAQGDVEMAEDTPVSPGSFAAAAAAAGATVTATRAVLAGQARAAYALGRPPGHPATPGRAMGFCLFNNVSVAAAWALAAGAAERLAIVDIDVHHGNGTQEIWAGDARVLYVSLHQYPLYPGSGGERDDEPPNVLNVPLPAHTGDRGYALAFDALAAPALRRFAPDVILVSAGYDAHWADPLSWMSLSIGGFHLLAQRLATLAAEICAGRLVWTLEGGYDLDALAHGVAASFAALLGRPYADPLGPAMAPEADVNSLVARLAAREALRHPSR
jgi:acetoin utilization deacetylase AcuC-like enzyme